MEDPRPAPLMPVTLLQGPLCGATIYDNEWLDDEEKEIRIAWEDFRCDIFRADGSEEAGINKVNIPREPSMNLRGTARYRKEGSIGHYVVER